MRKIIHVDMDAFFASVEQRDRPSLRGRPVIVGGTPDGRGVVAAASYEARKYGIRSAMSAAHAKRLCPHAVFLQSDFSKYSEASRQIHQVFREVTDLVEPLSLDEAYLDVTENFLDEPLAGKVARHLKRRIREETQLIASAGVGPNKMIAKLASDFDKPDGLVIVAPDRVDAFLRPLLVSRLHGVGPKTAARLKAAGIESVIDVRRTEVSRLETLLGSFGPVLHALAHGRDERAVQPHRVAKSRGAETTLSRDIKDVDKLGELIDRHAERIARSLKKSERPGKTITLKVRYSDFTTITRSKTTKSPTDDAARIAAIARGLLAETDAGRLAVRLIGVSVGGLVGEDESVQLELPLEADDPLNAEDDA